ncbi:MAG: DinB family protein [Planctomycetaceae bacterium]|nr:DinB family protein [Planctomycetaceae bacterium]
MTIAELMLPEFDREMARTRAVLAKVPPDQMNWQPSDGLRTIGWNANHLADIVGWTRSIIEHDSFDLAPLEGPQPETLKLEDPARILQAFEEAVADARRVLERTSDETMAENWSLKQGGQSLFTISKGDCLRTWVLNHAVHHRAILSVYLRMAGVEMTPVYDQ